MIDKQNTELSRQHIDLPKKPVCVDRNHWVLQFFVRVHLKFMVLVILVSNFTAATAATMHEICTLKIFYHLQSGLYRRVIGLG